MRKVGTLLQQKKLRMLLIIWPDLMAFFRRQLNVGLSHKSLFKAFGLIDICGCVRIKLQLLNGHAMATCDNLIMETIFATKARLVNY